MNGALLKQFAHSQRFFTDENMLHMGVCRVARLNFKTAHRLDQLRQLLIAIIAAIEGGLLLQKEVADIPQKCPTIFIRQIIN